MPALPHCAYNYIASYGYYHIYHTENCETFPNQVFGYGNSIGPTHSPANGCSGPGEPCEEDSIVNPTMIPYFLVIQFLKQGRWPQALSSLNADIGQSDMSTEFWEALRKLRSVLADPNSHFVRFPRSSRDDAKFLGLRNKYLSNSAICAERKAQFAELDSAAISVIRDGGDEDRIKNIERVLNSAIHKSDSLANLKVACTDLNVGLDNPPNSASGRERSFSDLFDLSDEYIDVGDSQDARLRDGKHYVKLTGEHSEYYFRLAELRFKGREERPDVSINVGFQVNKHDGFMENQVMADDVELVDKLCHSHILRAPGAENEEKLFHVYSTSSLEYEFNT